MSTVAQYAGPPRAGSGQLIPFIFGVSERSELSGSALTRLLADLGVSGSAARAAILRMRRAGSLTSRRDGREVRYRMTGAMAAGFHRLRAGGGTPVWDGGFHALLYQIPERHRAYRDSLRRAAILNGYGILQQGVLINPVDQAGHLTELADQPDGCQIHRARLLMGRDEAARAAVDAWSLAHSSARFASQADRLDAALAAAPDRPAIGAETLRTLHQLISPPLHEALYTPRLPAELLPSDWPMPRLWELIEALGTHYRPAVLAYVTAVLHGESGQ